MKTQCPDCQTVFRITPEQIKARAGKVRCGHCQTVFNALDSLIEDESSGDSVITVPAAAFTAPWDSGPAPIRAEPTFDEVEHDALARADLATAENDVVIEDFSLPGEKPLAPEELQEIGRETGLIHPRDTTEIPGYSKWNEGVVGDPFAAPESKSAHWPFTVAAIVFALVLAGQVIFQFRSELAVSAPSLRPLLEVFSELLGSSVPLPTHSELVSIESSDLQTDSARGNLLVLNATVRNRAPYGQAYPALELALTDTQDVAIVRRVFTPREYLPPALLADRPFPANSDLAVKLWIKADEISAAGYRLFVFYP